MAIGLSHGGTTSYSNPAPSRDLLVATLDGIVTLRRADSGWTIANRALAGNHISSIIFPQPDVVLAGIFKGGIVMSRDGGQNWERRDHGLAHNNVYSLAATQLSGGQRLFAGTEPAHFYVSDDLGQNWREMPALRSVPSVSRWTFPQEPHEGHVKYITTAPDDSATVYACIEQGGLFRSNDGGATWNELSGYDDDVHRILIHPRNAKLIYMMTGVGLYVSADGGASWERRTGRGATIGSYPDQLNLVPSHPELMFATGTEYNPGEWRNRHFAGSRVTRSRDGGRTWEIIGNGLPAPDKWQAAIEAMSLEEHGASCSIFTATTSGEIYASDDSGEHWALITQGLAPISKGGHYRVLAHAA
jgi:photosystem II stability/assembly factor-like uncharacterized protein